MLFDEGIKENITDFFDREDEINDLRNAIIEGRRLILVLGIRRTGKSRV